MCNSSSHFARIKQLFSKDEKHITMKFRAVMNNSSPIREFSTIVSTISKLSKECVLRIADDMLYFIVSDENTGPAPPVLWCEIPQSVFFSEYQLVGMDETHQDIYLGLNSGNLARSFVSLKNVKSLKMKLTKKQCPCLTLEIEVPSTTSHQTRQIVHDIPVAVVPWKNWPDFYEPRVPDPDISIELPSLKQLRTTIYRMRTMASEVMVRASAGGQLILQIRADMAKVSTRFKDLNVAHFDGPVDNSDPETDSQGNEDSSEIVQCRVDAKKLALFLNVDHISTNTTLCSIVHKRLVALCLQTDDNVKLQCFISGIVY